MAYWTIVKLNQKLIASGARKGQFSIKIWNWRKGNCLRTILGHADFIKSIIIVNNHIIISGSLDKSIRMWNW